MSSQSITNQFIGIGLPDRENAANGKISVNNRATIKRIKSNNISLSFSNNFIDRSLLTGKGLYLRIKFEMLLNNLITVNILVELSVTKQILSFKDNNRGMS